MSAIITLPSVREGRKTKSLTRPNAYKISGTVRVEHACGLSRHDAPWANIRFGFGGLPGAKKSKVVDTIRESLEFSDGMFDAKSKGILLVAESATLRNDGTVTVDFADSVATKNENGENTYGLVDGGTTTSTIVAAFNNGFVQSEDPKCIQYVPIEILCGYSDEEVFDIIVARNTSVEVDAFSKANYANAFKWVKETLESGKSEAGVKYGPFPQVSYFFGDEGKYDISDIIQIIALFAATKGTDAKWEPLTAYRSKKKVLDIFMDGMDEKTGLPKSGTSRECFRFSNVLLDILALREHLLFTVQSAYNATGGKFGALSLVYGKKLKHRDNYLPFIGEKIDFNADKAWLFPLLGAFRAALDFEGSKVTWQEGVNPFQLADAVTGHLFKEIKRVWEDECACKANALGTTGGVYTGLAQMVENYILYGAVSPTLSQKKKKHSLVAV